jgi:hypothetical protein
MNYPTAHEIRLGDIVRATLAPGMNHESRVIVGAVLGQSLDGTLRLGTVQYLTFKRVEWEWLAMLPGVTCSLDQLTNCQVLSRMVSEHARPERCVLLMRENGEVPEPPVGKDVMTSRLKP